jgi:hypothetical protein
MKLGFGLVAFPWDGGLSEPKHKRNQHIRTALALIETGGEMRPERGMRFAAAYGVQWR